MLRALTGLLAPPACLACRAPGTTPLCAACRRALRVLRPEAVCPRCGLPRPCDGGGGGRGRGCPAADAPWARAWAPVAYTGPATALVAALKFRGALPCASLMAAQVAALAPPGLLAGGVLAPVPTHPARARRRGYDQADVLACALARRSGLAVEACLTRAGPRSRQLGAGRAERLQDGRLHLRCRRAPPSRVVLVDDVHTTGATLRAAAAALRRGGAAEVVAVTWARTL
ncbi:double zinc ribbon domain-containing protein [Paraconexibacter antarcticus]|uniref:Double zinc ribbon domain-containing protein n=1 Tax=Paraconexibacter antarcticus TaxID=2949664 RepID=A0ABY5DYF7_9ACTN|nr:double zinc ribbon domain-containing protein [Paraconexibacter antarcticus]UTI65857.1 double zinc ribbon domain-containing protein [Paraconexibacter antarcticus]